VIVASPCALLYLLLSPCTPPAPSPLICPQCASPCGIAHLSVRKLGHLWRKRVTLCPSLRLAESDMQNQARNKSHLFCSTWLYASMHDGPADQDTAISRLPLVFSLASHSAHHFVDSSRNTIALPLARSFLAPISFRARHVAPCPLEDMLCSCSCRATLQQLAFPCLSAVNQGPIHSLSFPRARFTHVEPEILSSLQDLVPQDEC